MKSFSERQGLIKPREEVQIESMDSALRNGLWNCLTKHYWELGGSTHSNYILKPTQPRFYSFIEVIWSDLFKRTVDDIPQTWREIRKLLSNTFFEMTWNQVYDFIQFIPLAYPQESYERHAGLFRESCNKILERELSGYRFVGETIVPITSQQEIEAIEEAIESTEGLKTVNFHLQEAVRLWGDRKQPDYRNAIKEAISAVEALCGIIASKPRSTLGEALKAIEKQKKVDLHSALKTAFEKLYGFTSDAHGIRHALLDEPTLEEEDAKFMIISCSAFINYLIMKTDRSGLKL